MTDAVVALQLLEKFPRSFVVQVLDPRTAAGGHNLELRGFHFDQSGHEWTASAFKISENFNFVRKPLVGLGPAEKLVDFALVAEAHHGSLGVLNRVHIFSMRP